MLYLFLKGTPAVFYGGFTNKKDLEKRVNEVTEFTRKDFYYLDGRGNMKELNDR